MNNSELDQKNEPNKTDLKKQQSLNDNLNPKTTTTTTQTTQTTKSILDLKETNLYYEKNEKKNKFTNVKQKINYRILFGKQKKITDLVINKNKIIPNKHSSSSSSSSNSNYLKLFQSLFSDTNNKNLNTQSGLLSVNINMDESEQSIKQVQTNNSPVNISSSSMNNSIISNEQNVIIETRNEFNSKLNQKMTHYNLVETRAVILKVGDIDTINEKFYAEAFIEAKWIDYNLEPSIKYNPDVNWNPRLYVLNCLGELKQQIWYNQYSIKDYEQYELEKSNQKPSIIEENVIYHKISRKQINGSVILERRRISGQFWQTLNLKNFPADVQHLTISFSSLKQANEIQIYHSKEKPSTVNIKHFVDSQEWRLYKHITVREYLRDSVFSSETFPAIDLTMYVARKPTFYYWNAYFLIFLITMASLSIFSIRCHLNANRIQTTSTLLLTSVTFKWIINRTIPTVSYMTSLDKYSIVCMLLLCAQCVWHSIISSMLDLDQKCDYPFSYYDHIAFILACTIFLFVQVVFIGWLLQSAYKKRRQLNKEELDYTNEIMGKRSTRLKSMLYGI